MKNSKSRLPRLSAAEQRYAEETVLILDAMDGLSKAADIDMANQLCREVIGRGINHATACLTATNILAMVITEKGAPTEAEQILFGAVGLLLEASIQSLREKERRDLQ